MTPCDLYLVLPQEFEPNQAIAILPDLLRHPEVTALRIPYRFGKTTEIVRVAQNNDVAVLVSIDQTVNLSEFISGNIDGVHLTDIDALSSARRIIGDDVQLGCKCETRDQAMQAGEKGADYVSFDADQLETVTWWASVMELPAVVEGVTNAEIALASQKAGADFLAIPLTLDHTDTLRLNAVLDVVRS
ncbi:thiamine phosphate synthase [Gluconobacter wancherniae]|uniref:Thiamine phosphate synthase n=1 Tax=Gluconobacter wancherniae NBRC 103581 TaxID=656744 RepID=A0A511B974_9PROT|nr:thiamine phosphate synthase [Gluconobacter wancherniae]MBF0853811.1 thiamine phosphate synthase [Gluconobacter wancherniae]GBD56866.1 thiamine phosphate synthase [Gluconobacter wancherniae NBRC 103581]GBR64719.1 thiamine monophosphate synthase [Gluconobacter wancherniae NBRC 103581]GEK94367.1 thiamine phosphate synthase [Gluconobacter wancherniae NBRC 103581]